MTLSKDETNGEGRSAAPGGCLWDLLQLADGRWLSKALAAASAALAKGRDDRRDEADEAGR